MAVLVNQETTCDDLDCPHSAVRGAVEKKRRVAPQTVEFTGLLAAALRAFVARVNPAILTCCRAGLDPMGLKDASLTAGLESPH